MGKAISDVTNKGFHTYITNIYDDEGVEIYKIKLFLTNNDYIELWSYPVSNDIQIITTIDVYTPKIYFYDNIHVNSEAKDLLKKNMNFIIKTNKESNLIQWVMDTNNRIIFRCDRKKTNGRIYLIRLYWE
ncbi:MAG: hypothetical protein ACP5QT_06830 [Brevinematia bacterium]